MRFLIIVAACLLSLPAAANNYIAVTKPEACDMDKLSSRRNTFEIYMQTKTAGKCAWMRDDSEYQGAVKYRKKHPEDHSLDAANPK